MNQIERDLTYRLDALKEGCNEYGWESEWCKSSIQIWEEQHRFNIRMERHGDYVEAVFQFILFLFFVFFILGKWIKYSAIKENGKKG